MYIYYRFAFLGSEDIVCCIYWTLAVTKKIFNKSIFHSAFKFSTCLHYHSLLLFLCGTQDLHEALPFGSIQSQSFCFFLAFSCLLQFPFSCSFPVFFVYPSSLYLECSSPVHVFLLHLVVYIVYGKSNAIFFPLFVVQ